MKKLILSIALVGAATFAFGQKKVVREAEKGFKSGDLAAALTAIDAATTNPETSGDPTTFLLKAQIQTKMFGADSTNTMETLEIGNAAYATFEKTMEMAGGDKASAAGKGVYAEELPGIPENLRPYSINSLKNLSFDKAIERYNEEDLEMAYEFFNLAGEIDKTDSTIHYNAGFLANDLGRFEDAKKHFNYLFALPDYNKLNAYYFMVQILSTEEQNPEGAYDMVTKARLEYPEDKVLAEYEIQLLLQLNRMDQAMAQIKEALANDPNNPGLWLRSGYLKEQSGDVDGGLADYKKSVEIDPEFYQGNYYTGALLLEMSTKMLNSLNDLSDAEWEKQSPIVGAKADENYREAAKYFTKASELQPENTDVMIILFQVHTRLKNTAEAEKYNQKLIQLLGPNWMDN
ncbi:tetratricopeptide repeat protein [Algoriphagus boseongensis]|uniref:Tetratricopeptide repeat protein n=1 Tax=Algoriphagus boseongensis TaxID=1442587 RepID=A0A4R6T7X7_9BACT|nr:tetratricopeptide repeat protein [Algoriphagus boseongensis]TDQ18786.1 tetratricopeptide repeat protein [Algoriphagus boseongensis]